MRIALTTIGSTGDIQPFLALGTRLIAEGHDVLALSHPFHQTRFESLGIPFHPCGPIVTQDDLNLLLDRMIAQANPLNQIRLLMHEAFFVEGEAFFQDAKAGLQGRDLAICHMIDFLSQEAVVQLGIPRICVLLTHAIVPTPVSTPADIPNLGPFNPLIWWAMTKIMRPVDREALQFLKRVGGPSIQVQRFASLAPQLNFLAASTLLSGVPETALPAHIIPTGPWILQEPAYTSNPQLEHFLQQYPRPIIMSLGSMGGTQGPRLTRIFLDAIQTLGNPPAIIQGGYAGLSAPHAPPNILFIDYVPHTHLFAQAACVVHHGGAGTTMAACRAGAPSVIIPFIADQPYFADRLRRLGIAPRPLPYRSLTAPRLAQRIQHVLSNPAMQEKARALQPAFLAEDGLTQAIRHIHKFITDLKSTL